MRIKKSTVFLTMFVLLLAFTGCQNESSSTDENKQTKITASDKVIYNQKDLQNPQKLEISEDGTVEMEIKSMTEPDNILPENKSIFLSITSKEDTDVSLQYTYDTYGKERLHSILYTLSCGSNSPSFSSTRTNLLKPL